MKLQMKHRPAEKKKSDVARMRREGSIPAIIYVQGKPSEMIMVDSSEFAGLMRQVLPGRLSTTVFTLSDGEKKERKVILKEIQYHVTTYDVIHLDFEELKKDTKITVKVPIECTGVADCVGVKAGGTIRQVIRTVKVECLPKDMPTAFEVDIKNLDLFAAKRLSDLSIPDTVRPLANLNEVAVIIVKR